MVVRNVRAALVVVTLVTFGWSTTALARRVGFANVARDGVSGLGAIEKARAEVVERLGPDELGAGPAREALEAPVAADEGEAATLARARKLLGEADGAFRAFEYDTAFDRLRQADAALRGLHPTPDVVATMADVNLLWGQVWAARQDEARALEAFRVVRRLAPDRVALDPAKFRPQIVQLYEKAGKAPDGDGARAATVAVTTEPPGATVWVDGKVAGTAPLDLADLAPGDHYVAATLDGHAPRAERLSVQAGGRSEQTFLLARLPAEQRARAIRLGLLRGAGPADWGRAAADLADVASVDVLVVVRDREGGGLEWAAYDQRTGKLASWVPMDKGVGALVDTLPKGDGGAISVPRPEDVAKKVDLEGGRKGQKLPPKKPEKWYRTWWGTSVLIGAGLVLVGGVLWATAPGADDWPATFCWVGDPGCE